MLKRSGKKSGPNAGSQASHSAALEAIDALYTLEMKANLAALRDQRRRTRLHQTVSNWTEYWPVAVGIVISLFAPQLRDMVSVFRPWGMWIVFPFVSLAGRPEVYMGDGMAALLPLVMLYAQFPLEGLLARVALKGNVTLTGVFGQVLFFHTLCIIELWLVNGAFWQVLRH